MTPSTKQVDSGYIDTDAALKEIIPRLKKADRVALDIEANSLHNYFQKVCLIQITFDDESHIIDPLADINLSKFLQVLSRKNLLLHGGDYDLRMMRSSLEFHPHGEIFDTMLAAKLLGIQSFGLVSLADQFLNVTLTKAGQKSDWTQRPLTPAQLKYAADDTRYLAPLVDAVRQELDKLGRTPWHKECCARMVASTVEIAEVDHENAWRIKGAALLGRHQLVYLRELWRWREHEASKADRPPFKIMPPQQLLHLASWAQAHPGAALSDGPRLPRHCNGRRLKGIQSALEKAADLPKAEWPPRRKRVPPPERPLPSCRNRVEVLRKEGARLAEELGIDAGVLAPRRALTALARSHPEGIDEIMETGPLMRWQAVLLEPAVRRAMKVAPD